MRKLSKMVLLSVVVAPLFVMGCGDDDGSDNPSGGGTSNEGGDGGTSGKNTGGTSTSGSGGSGGSGGTKADAGEPAVGGGGAGNEPFTCDWDALEDGGAIPVDADNAISEDTTLESGKTYTFDGSTSVLDGVTLTIQPCVQIVGESPEAVLGILPGAKIEAAGLPDAPIVFTSAAEPGERAPGDWGGLIIMGNALVNQPTPLVEGLVEATGYGSTTDANNDESSGTLQYIRIEYVGREISADSEVNGITFAGVGSGTVVDHIMVSNSSDDCFEWFGGAVNAHHLIALNCDDDMFDTDYAFSGSIQYAFGRAFESSTEKDSNGFEMDTGQNENIDPQTTAQWANVTLCGANTGAAPTLPRIGMVLRRQVSGSITNAIVTGFDSGAFSVRDTALVPPTDTTLTSSAIFGNLSVYGPSHDGAADWFEAEATNETLEEAPAGFDCYSNPPAPIPNEDLAGVDPGGSFEAAEYKGAFKAGENWMTGAWVSWDEN